MIVIILFIVIVTIISRMLTMVESENGWFQQGRYPKFAGWFRWEIPI